MATARGMAFATKISWDDKISPIRNAAKVRQETGMPGTRGEWLAERGHAYLRSLCHQLWNDPQFNADGQNLGCCRNFWGDFGGNVFRDGFAATFNHDKMKRARLTLLGKREPAPDLPCATCDLYLEMKRSGAYLTQQEIEKRV